jgi:hypothetical protein
MIDRSGRSDAHVLYADDIVDELKQGSSVPKSLHNKSILGKFDLSNLVINAPLEFHDCCFEGEVDLTYCEFQQVVDFSRCTFREKFNSGDATHSLTIYHKDLICHESCFENVAYFNGIRVEGDAHFVDSCFELEGLETPLPSQLGSRYTVDFTDAHFGCELVCDNATFKGPVTFKAVECGGSGSFDRCRFITETRIEDEAEINFNWASFGRNLWCRGAVYAAEVNFRSLKCGYNAFFKNTSFDEEVDLRFLDLGRDLDLRWTFWAKRAKLAQIQVPKKLSLGGACFQGPVDLYDSNIGVLELWDPNHPDDEAIQVRTTREDTLEVIVGKDQDELEELERTEEDAERLASKLERPIRKVVPFGGDAKDAKKAEEWIEKLFPFKLRDERSLTGLNLTGTTFARFHGGPNDRLAQKLALKLANKQDPTKFSMDPYLQLRDHYLKIGDEARAREMRVQGYHGLRENAWQKEGRTSWTSKRWLAEYLLYRPTSYGYRVWHLLLPSLLLLFIAGTIMFWPTEALSPTSPETKGPAEIPPNSNFAAKVFERSVYSLDLLIPALDLRYEAMWMPSQLHSLAYAIVHSILGWVLIALLLAWLTGVIKPPD